jgi:hypothetical protein
MVKNEQQMKIIKKKKNFNIKKKKKERKTPGSGTIEFQS